MGSARSLDAVDVEVVVHLLHEADVLTGELAPGTRQRPQVRRDVVRPLGVEAVGPRQFGDQPLRLAGEVGGIRRWLRPDDGTQRGIAGERVDVTLLDAVEPQTEEQVLANDAA